MQISLQKHLNPFVTKMWLFPDMNIFEKFWLTLFRKIIFFRRKNGWQQLLQVESYNFTIISLMLMRSRSLFLNNTHDDPVITCKVELPLKEALDALAGNMWSTKKKVTSWNRFNMISRLYGFIKRKNADVILAIIPQYNKLYYLDSDGKINRNRKITDSVYDTPLIFIKDTPEGRIFLKKQIIP